MDDAVFDELMDSTFDAPAASQSGVAPTGATLDPEAAGWVVDDQPGEAASTEAAQPEPTQSVTQSEEPALPDIDPSMIWDLDENPYKQQMQSVNAKLQQAIAVQQQMRVQQAMVEMDRHLQQRIEALPDMEPEELTKEVQRLISERDTARNLVTQAQIANQNRQAEHLAKTQVVQILAERHAMTEQEIATMASLSDPYQMERYAQMAQQTRQQAMSEVEQLRQQLAQYQMARQAQERRGVDRVGSSVPTTGRAAPNPARSFDEFWESFVNEG